MPKDIGAYIWRTKKDNIIVYVGRAIGERGLFQRIVKQHLYRSYKMSVFKKQVADEFSLDIKEQAVSYIKDNFTFSFIQFGRKDKYIVNLVETLMINEYRPKYNRAGKYD